MSEVTVKCNCKTVMKDGKPVMAAEMDQPMVIVRTALDPKFLVGHCPKCGKIHTINRREEYAKDDGVIYE